MNPNFNINYGVFQYSWDMPILHIDLIPMNRISQYGSVSKPCTVPLVNIKIAGKWMFIPLKMVLIGIDPYPYQSQLLQFPGLLAVQLCFAALTFQVPSASAAPTRGNIGFTHIISRVKIGGFNMF